MKAAIEQVFDGSIAQVAAGGAYDPTKINRGKHTGQFDLGSGPNDKFIGPCPVGVANFGESPLAMPSAFVHPVKITDDLFWIFGSDVAAAAATRRVQLWTWVPSTNTYTLQGFIILTFPTTGNVTARGLRAILENYTTGTVSVSGTAVTGSGTVFLTQCEGSRIGFGSTDPNQITTWYAISTINSDTSITLGSGAGTISAGTPYVIQDLMIVHAQTNATAGNGGLFVAKGVRFEDFAPAGNTIPAATTADRKKAVYWLKDAGSITNTAIGGCALGDRDSWTQQYVYACDGASTTLKLFRYNIRAPLAPVSGAFTLTGSDIVVTGNQSVTGNISQANNGRVATLTHGAGDGVPSLYLLTTTRIVRVPLSSIVAGSTTYVADSMSETPPGGASTNGVAGSAPFTSLDVAGSLDKLLIGTTGGSGTIYITDYYTGGQALDRRAGCHGPQQVGAARDSDLPVFVHTSQAAAANMLPFVWVEDGWLFWLYNTTATPLGMNALSAYPLAADLEFQAEVNNRVICPRITLGATPAKLYRVLVNCVENLGDHTMGITPDMYQLQVRTSGIDDNTGAWTDVAANGDLSGIGTPSAIQFAFRWRTAGLVMLPARVLSLALLYETDDALPSQYQWNFGDFNASNGTFGFIQVSSLTITTHTINIYRADTDALVLTQASTGTTNGTFEYWTGSAWTAGLGSDSVGTRRRFVPSGSLPGGVDLYAKLTVA